MGKIYLSKKKHNYFNIFSSSRSSLFDSGVWFLSFEDCRNFFSCLRVSNGLSFVLISMFWAGDSNLFRSKLELRIRQSVSRTSSGNGSVSSCLERKLFFWLCSCDCTFWLLSSSCFKAHTSAKARRLCAAGANWCLIFVPAMKSSFPRLAFTSFESVRNKIKISHQVDFARRFGAQWFKSVRLEMSSYFPCDW